MNQFSSSRKVLGLGFLVAVTLFALPLAVDAAVLLTDLGTNTDLRNNGDHNFRGTIGYSFTVDTSGIVVTALGVYDAPGNEANVDTGTLGDGLEDQAPVALFKADGTLLASVIVPVGGSEGTVVDHFRYVDLGMSVALTAGETYVLAMGVSQGGNGFLNRSVLGGTDDAALSDGFTYGDAWYATNGSSSDVVFPTTHSAALYAAFVGPNLQHIPEPASLALLILGGLAMVGCGRR